MSPFDLFTNLLIGACFTVNTILLYESKTSFLCYMWKPLLKHPKRILLTAAYINLIIMCCIMQQYYSSTFLPIEIIDPKTDKNIVFAIWCIMLYALTCRADSVTKFREEHIAYINGAIVYYHNMEGSQISPYLDDDDYTEANESEDDVEDEADEEDEEDEEEENSSQDSDEGRRKSRSTSSGSS
ncbi:hypothetical protein PMZ80_002393 [Knufia obscura]|uniref:Uncharacterized protein n=2 Tax=Knufia TaxID=430999 RepID=A0AAN8I3P8_9EURO|nr:hypothetical protein PMZ80_002393 [Knufia obscura]KAK5948606.1 hypothetical protein OHC33_010365 [Knufia fluminis]